MNWGGTCKSRSTCKKLTLSRVGNPWEAEFKKHLDEAKKARKKLPPQLQDYLRRSLRMRVHDELENLMRACNLPSAAPVSMAFAAVATASRT